ncbi:hypothetical protein [Chitinibacter sp. GC72]|uniref:hypothetical protein n=1 Tax=Chitinibacter sp. GC72 TaxID=1526917 RepID=UPI0012FA341C|nr:hypothetical protein [Chitinibacter sp. GC72]
MTNSATATHKATSVLTVLAAVLTIGSMTMESAQANEVQLNAAIEKGDYQQAFNIASAEHKKGSASLSTRILLAQMYMQGKGTSKNISAARSLIDPLVAQNKPEAQLLLSNLLKQEAMQGLTKANGRIDEARYQALAKRSLKERENERYAAELMYKSAQQGFHLAIESVCNDIASSVTAFGSKERANWYRKCANKEAWARASEIGNSIAPLNLRREVMRDPVVTEAFQQLATKAKCTNEDITPVDFKIGKPVSGGEYLTLNLPKPTRQMMVRGQWQEIWVGKACGKTMSLPIAFKADGMGGATFSPDLPAAELNALKMAVQRQQQAQQQK